MPLLVGGAIVLLVVTGLVWSISGFLGKKPQGPQRAVEQKITMIRPTPPETPPPPPPPPEEKIEEPLEQPEPEQAPEETSPAEQLGLDADGTAGADGFGLAARKGGRDLLGTGTGAFVWYTTLLKDQVLETLSRDERIRKGTYQVSVKFWVANDGKVERYTLSGSSGNPDLDRAIEGALSRIASVREGPPLEMPQPITLRIVSRG